MTYAAANPGYAMRAVRRRGSRGPSPHAVFLAVTVGISAGVAGWVVGGARAPVTQNIVVVPAPGATVAAAPAVRPVRSVAQAMPAAPPMLEALLDPRAINGGAAASFEASRPVSAAFAWTAPENPSVMADASPAPATSAVGADVPVVADVPVPPPAPPEVVATDDGDTELAPNALPPLPPPSPLLQSVPLPMPRPTGLETPAATSTIRRLPVQMAQRGRSLPAPASRPDGRNFLERLFSPEQQSGPALAYAAPEESAIGRSGGLFSGGYAAGGGTALYDISAHTVTLPDGTQLEAHSGLGMRFDDPRFVADRNRGPTPPHLYDLTLRESLFHGVQALRLNPVGGGGIYGRAGLLAHTFMLGARGDSNGCVSFRNYNAFLQAYRRGQIRRLLVVASR